MLHSNSCLYSRIKLLEVERGTGIITCSPTAEKNLQNDSCWCLVLSPWHYASICGKGQQVILLGPLPKKQHFPVLSHSSLLPCHVVCLELILEWEIRVNLSSFLFLYACISFFYGSGNRTS